MSVVLFIIGLSIIVQAVAGAAALRLHWVHGHRWAWAFVSAAILLMTIRRCITFYRILTGDVADHDDLDEPSPLMASAVIALVVSSLFLIGVSLLEPAFRDIRRAEDLLRGEKENLAGVVRLNETEFRLAQQIQQSLFPDDAPHFAGFDIAGASHPALSAGGDLYDYLSMPNGSLAVVIADVSGHGVGPAMIMAETRAYLRAITETTSDCGEVLTRLNRYLCQTERTGFVTCLIVKLDAETRVFSFASAGHEGYVVDRDGPLRRLESQGPPLGVIETTTYESLPGGTLSAGCLLALLTDGLLEAQSPDRKMFGPKRMLSILSDSGLKSSRDMVSRLHHAVGDFSEWAPPKDDMTAVVVRAS